MSALSLHALTKQYGTFTAVDHVSLHVNVGEVYGLIGPNGAGKSTIIKIITGVLFPTSGKVVVSGHAISDYPNSVKKDIGYMPDVPVGYDYLSGKEFLIFTGRLRGLHAGELEKRIEELLQIFPVSDIIYRPMGEYSLGMRQKVVFLSTLLTNPEILIIDEPLVGLDPQGIKILEKVLKEYVKNGHAVFLVTHILDFAVRVANRIGVLKDGKLIREMEVTKSLNPDLLL